VLNCSWMRFSVPALAARVRAHATLSSHCCD
jgi:hypothetical protein